MTPREEIAQLKADNKALRDKYINQLDSLMEIACFIETLQQNVIYLLEKDEDALEKSI